jgi:hypothetical protein
MTCICTKELTFFLLFRSLKINHQAHMSYVFMLEDSAVANNNTSIVNGSSAQNKVVKYTMMLVT